MIRSLLFTVAVVLVSLFAGRSAEAQGIFVRGNCDQIGDIDITDSVFLLTYLFLGGTVPTCLDACDVNDDEFLNLTDAINNLSFLFLGGLPPAPPYPDEDLDPLGEALTCLNGRDPPVELMVRPERCVFYKSGQSLTLEVLGRTNKEIEDDDPFQDYRLHERTEYSSSHPLVCDVSAEGVITTGISGTAIISVTNRRAVATVRVEVGPGIGRPGIWILHPADGAIVTSSQALLSGFVTDPQADLDWNGTPMENTDGQFAALMNLSEGATTIVVTARTPEDETRVSIRVHRVDPESPEATAIDGGAIPHIEPPEFAEPDNVAPTISLLTPTDGAMFFPSFVEVSGSIDDPTAEVRVNGVPAEQENGTFRVSLRLPAGNSQIVAEATDPVGNVDTETINVRVDGEAPRLALTEPTDTHGTLVLPPGDAVYAGTVTPAGTPVTVNGVAAQVTGTTWTTTLNLGSGPHDLVVTASLIGDRRCQLVRRVIVDDEAPALTLAFPPEGGSVLRAETATLRVTGRASDVVVPRHANDVALTINDLPATFHDGFFRAEVPLSGGINTLRFRATDGRGNATVRDFSVLRGGAPAATLAIVSGDQQTVPAGGNPPAPLVVEARSSAGTPQANQLLTFRIVQGGGVFVGGSRTLETSTGADGRASVTLRGGVDAGPGALVVTVSSAVHANSPIAFVLDVTTGATRVLLPRGATQLRGLTGTRMLRPLATRLFDAFGNEIAGANVEFTVIEGDATFGGETTFSTETDASGVASAFLTVPFADPANLLPHRIEARHAAWPPVAFDVQPVIAGVAADTVLSGTVIDPRGQPVAGATIRLFGLDGVVDSVVSDASGGFRLVDVPCGEVLLDVVGPAGFGAHRRRVRIFRGEFAVLERPVVLVRIADGGRTELISDTRGALLSLPEIPGLRVEVAAGSAVFPGGSQTGELTLVAPNALALPAPPPDGIVFAGNITILPRGVRFDPPATLRMPNASRVIIGAGGEGQVLPLYQYHGANAAFGETAAGLVDKLGLAVAEDARGLRSGGHYFFSQRGRDRATTGTIEGRLELVTPGYREVAQHADSHVFGFNVLAHSGELFVDETELREPPETSMKHGSSFGNFFEVMHMEYGSKTARLTSSPSSAAFFGLASFADFSNHDDMMIKLRLGWKIVEITLKRSPLTGVFPATSHRPLDRIEPSESPANDACLFWSQWATPSLKSAWRNERCIISTASAYEASSVCECPSRTSRLVAALAAGDVFFAMLRAYAMVSRISSSTSSKQRSASLSRSASSPKTTRDENKRSRAVECPTIRGSIHADPCSATSPRFVNAVVNLAFLWVKRMSHINAVTRPRPAQAPLTAATTGFSHARSCDCATDRRSFPNSLPSSSPSID